MLAPQDNVVPLPSMWQHTLVLMWPGRWVSHSYSTVHDESYCCMIKWSEWFSAALREKSMSLGLIERKKVLNYKNMCSIQVQKLYLNCIIIPSSINQKVLKIDSFQWRWQIVSTQIVFLTSCAFYPFFSKDMTKGLLCFVHNENECDFNPWCLLNVKDFSYLHSVCCLERLFRLLLVWCVSSLAFVLMKLCQAGN